MAGVAVGGFKKKKHIETKKEDISGSAARGFENYYLKIVYYE